MNNMYGKMAKNNILDLIKKVIKIIIIIDK